jgi:hypothetical protein
MPCTQLNATPRSARARTHISSTITATLAKPRQNHDVNRLSKGFAAAANTAAEASVCYLWQDNHALAYDAVGQPAREDQPRHTKITSAGLGVSGCAAWLATQQQLLMQAQRCNWIWYLTFDLLLSTIARSTTSRSSSSSSSFRVRHGGHSWQYVWIARGASFSHTHTGKNLPLFILQCSFQTTARRMHSHHCVGSKSLGRGAQQTC